jgi:hypothetical protein
MSAVIVRLSKKTITATHQGVTATGMGYDLNNTKNISIYNRGNRNWEYGYHDREADEVGPVIRRGYYVSGKLHDGMQVMFGDIVTQASDDDVEDVKDIGHIRKIKGQWKFRSGHWCEAYGRDKYGFCTRCGDGGQIWKD